MWRATLPLLLALLSPPPLAAQEPSDPVSQAIAQGDFYQSKRKFDLALDAYRKADKLAHHTSAPCYLKIAFVEHKLGNLSSALDNAKRALKAAGQDKSPAVVAYLFRAGLLAQMAGKATDKKLREAEEDLRQALALDPKQPLTHFDLGIVLLRQERDSEGVAELNAFVSSPRAESAKVAEARRFIANPIRAREPFAPDFSFLTRENLGVSNASLRGKVVLLDFWGTWCPPCRESVPILRNLQKKYTGKPFQLIGISSDENEGAWRTFIEARHMDWPEYIDLSGTVQGAFKIDAFPTYIVLDKDSVIRFRESGLSESTQGDLEDAINKALKRPSNPALAQAAPAPPPPASSSNASGATPDENRTPDATPPLAHSGIEAGVASGNVYKNDALGMSYEFPKGWTAASPESLHALNERAEAAAKAAALQLHPESAGSIRLLVPKILLYASAKGEGDGQRLALPSLRITAVRSSTDSLNLDAFRLRTAQIALPLGEKIVNPASGFEVNEHLFLRTDFERTSGASHFYHSYIQTLAGDYLLTIELFAPTLDELQQIAASLQSISI